MGNKKQLVIVAALLVLSFAVSCGVSLILGGGATPPPPTGQAFATTRPSSVDEDLTLPTVRAGRLMPKRRQLEELIRDVRVKLTELERREDLLDQREKRIKVAQGLLKKEAEHLESLRVRLVGPMARLKEAMLELSQTVVQIDVVERKNLKKMAKVYDKMDPESCGRIFLEKCKNQKEDDVAKIFYYMSERSHAKVLAEISKADQAAADKVTDRLKRMKEQG